MRFGEYLLENSIPAWSSQYLNYNKLKAILREFQELNRKTGSVHSFDSPPSRAKPSRASHTAASPNTLSVLRPIAGGIDVIHEMRQEEHHTYLNSENSAISSTKKSYEASKLVSESVAFDLSYLIPIIQSCIESQEHNEQIQAKKLEIEQKFLSELQSEMSKVSQFYHQQQKYFANQAETLMSRLRAMVQNTTPLISRKQSSPKRNIKDIETELSKHFETEAAASTSSIHVHVATKRRENANASTDAKSKAIKENKERKQLQKLFRVTYHAIVRNLSSYRLLNVTAIQKICKKHDKHSHFKHLESEMNTIIDSVSNFGDNYFEQYLVERIEDAYGQFLKSPRHRKKCEAIQQLRALGTIHEALKPNVHVLRKQKRQQRQRQFCRIGFYAGSSIAMLVVCFLLLFIGKSTNPLNDDKQFTFEQIMESAETYRAFYALRASFLVSWYLWLFGVNLWVWKRKRFNHPFIFEADPSSLLESYHVFLSAGSLTCASTLIGTLYLLVFIYQKIVIQIDLWIFTLILYAFWVGFFVIFPIQESTRKYLLSSFWRIIRAPFTKVHFVDFFIADQWCSLFTIIVDIAFSGCFFATGEFLWDGPEHKLKADYQEHSFCANHETKMYIKLLRFYPFWLRFMQCMKRFYDARKPQHLANAGKYATCILTSIVSTIDDALNSETDRDVLKYPFLAYIRLLLAISSTIYGLLWDYIKDWGLLRIDCKYLLLRKESELRFKPVYYYAAMIINLLFRMSWAVFLFPHSLGLAMGMHYWTLGLGAIEILRRCMWNVFRLENEHINNCGEFRVCKDIPPLPRDDEEGDEDGGVVFEPITEDPDNLTDGD